MSEPINLRQFRKMHKREEKENVAAENRTIFGRTLLEKKFDNRQKQKTESFLEKNSLSNITLLKADKKND